MQCFQLHLSAATRKTNGLSLRNAAPTLPHNSAQHAFVYRMALKGLKPIMGLHHANSQTRTRTLALPLSRSASVPSASMPSAAAEWAKPSRSAAALRRLACGILLNLRSSVVQHPRGDAIPNPFPHRHSIYVISNNTFHFRFVSTCAVNVQILRRQDTCLTLRRPPWSHSGLSSPTMRNTTHTHVSASFCHIPCENKGFQLWRRCAITFASPCLMTFIYKTTSKVVKYKQCSQVIANLVAEIGHTSDHRRHQNVTFFEIQIHSKS